MESSKSEGHVYRLFRASVWLKVLISAAELAGGLLIFFAPFWVFTSIIGVYIFLRGLVKVLVLWGLLAGKLWAYPASIAIIGLFILYQFYQIWAEHSWVIVAITLFDFVVLYFIVREYQIVRAHLKGV